MLLLIDGSNLAHRALHALYKDTGYYNHMEAIPYFLKRLFSFVNYQQLLAGVIVAWDKGLPLHRRRLYPEYKPDSKPLGQFDSSFLSKLNKDSSLDPHREAHGNETFREEYHRFIDILSSVIVPCCNCISSRVTNTEADDIIAFCCYYLKDIEKQIISSDRDLLQLIDETTSVYNFASGTKNSNLYDYEWLINSYDDPKWFREHFLVEKAIIGDTSDNIPGIESIGKTTAKKYADNIIHSRKLTNSLNEAIQTVERPERATKKGWENLKSSPNIVQRNIDIMDLYLPLQTKSDMVYSIQRNLSSFVNFRMDYYVAMDKLEAIEKLDYNGCHRPFDKIFESNCNYEIKPVLETLRDAF